MILQVNDVSFEHLSNDDAVKVLREAVSKPGPVKLVIAKGWDPNPQDYLPLSRKEPVRPINTSAWVAHTQAHNNHNHNKGGGHHPGSLPVSKTNPNFAESIYTFGSNTSCTTSSIDETFSNTFTTNTNQTNTGSSTIADPSTFNSQLDLTVDSDMEEIVKAMFSPNSGLDVRDRTWLKLTIPNAVIGADIVDWLFNHVEGFPERRDARKYASNLLKYRFIRHAVNNSKFSEQCYYVIANANISLFFTNQETGNLFTLNEESETDFDSVSELENETLYAPMSFAPMQLGSYLKKKDLNNPSQQQKIYSNLPNGVAPQSYMSSSSSANSNVTSYSATSKNNSSIASSMYSQQQQQQQLQLQQNMIQKQNYAAMMGNQNSLSNKNNNNSNSNNAGNYMVNNDRTNTCQFYYPPPTLNITSMINNTTNNSYTFNNQSVDNTFNAKQNNHFNTVTSISTTKLSNNQDIQEQNVHSL